MIAVWPGHGWKTPGQRDPGARSALGPSEADWTARLGRRLAVALEARGPVLLLEAGSYSDRAALADGAGSQLVLHLHGDVGPARIYHYPGSAEGQRLARLMAAALGPVLGELPVTPATVGGYPRANGLLARTRAPAVLLELVDQRGIEALQLLLERLDQVAVAIAGALAPR